MKGSNPLTSPVDIRPDHLEIVQGILREHLPVGVKVWVFGSRANWTTKDSSDLDIALEGETKLSHKLLGALKDAFEDSTLPYTVDVVDLHAVSHAFKQIVKEQRVALPLVRAPGRVDGAWREVTLGDVAELVMGQSPPGAKVSGDNGLALLNGPTEFGVSHPTPVQFTTDARKYAQPGDILFCVRGSTTGRMNWADQEYAIGRGVAAIRHKNDSALQPFVRGVVELGLPELLAQATGSTFPNVSAQQLAEIPYPRLDEDEQRAIAHILGTLDDKIELNRRMNETLEAMARALFKSWFVDFEPVRAKMEGRWRPGESLPGLATDLYELFPDRLVDSQLGEVPEGWGVKGLGDCIDVERGLSYKGSGLSSSGVPMHNLNSIYEGGGYKDGGIKYYNGDYQPRHIVKPGEVIVANTEQGHDRLLIGFAAIVPKRFGDRGLFSHHIYQVRPKSSLGLTHEYICQLLNTQVMHDTVSGYATGTTVNMLPIDALRIPEIVVPNIQLVTTFSTIAEAARIRREQGIEESRSLAAQRDSLLPRLVSGEMGVA